MLEAVPNVSEGCSRAVVTTIERAFARGAHVLDVHADCDHHRSVFTLIADPGALVEALLAGISAAIALVDLRSRSGVHPRVGAIDVVPVVPFSDGGIDLAMATALEVSARVGQELGLPVFHYGEIGHGRRPAFFRAGGLEELRRRVAAGELVPDAGPREITPMSGVALVGARWPLVAYNLVLETGELAIGRDIATAVRESSGGMPGVQAIGLLLPSSGHVQVSMNVVDIERAPLHQVVERVRAEAEARGTSVTDGEVVGLVPASVRRAAVEAGVDVPGLDESCVLERVLESRLES